MWPSLLDLPLAPKDGSDRYCGIPSGLRACHGRCDGASANPVRHRQRIVVDEASTRARKIARALCRAIRVLSQHATQLRTLAGDVSAASRIVRRAAAPPRNAIGASPASRSSRVDCVDKLGRGFYPRLWCDAAVCGLCTPGSSCGCYGYSTRFISKTSYHDARCDHGGIRTGPARHACRRARRAQATYAASHHSRGIKAATQLDRQSTQRPDGWAGDRAQSRSWGAPAAQAHDFERPRHIAAGAQLRSHV